MIHRPRFHPPPYIYPPDEWNLIEKRFMPDLLEQGETMFALGNGYLGMRGCFEEGGPIGQNGTFINGFYEAWPIVYPEEAYGLAPDKRLSMSRTPRSSNCMWMMSHFGFLMPMCGSLTGD